MQGLLRGGEVLALAAVRALRGCVGAAGGEQGTSGERQRRQRHSAQEPAPAQRGTRGNRSRVGGQATISHRPGPPCFTHPPELCGYCQRVPQGTRDSVERISLRNEIPRALPVFF